MRKKVKVRKRQGNKETIGSQIIIRRERGIDNEKEERNKRERLQTLFLSMPFLFSS